jgi:predicted 3-demethylubiquinone-9 3-methyltransferase (glyoxalase superfamily)
LTSIREGGSRISIHQIDTFYRLLRKGDAPHLYAYINAARYTKSFCNLVIAMSLSKISPCLWFNGQAEDAANLYTSVFKDAKITAVQRYKEAGKEVHGHEAGTVLLVAFQIAGQSFTALNGGPQYTFTPAVSFQIDCDDQAEVDHFWEKLGAGGDESKQRCGWLVDRFGVSWQVIPKALKELLSGSDPAGVARVTTAMMAMKKLDVADLRKAYDG